MLNEHNVPMSGGQGIRTPSGVQGRRRTKRSFLPDVWRRMSRNIPA